MKDQQFHMVWRKRALQLVVVASLLLATAGLAAAQGASEQFPTIIQLPVGFEPEGIATGRGHSFYAGSLADGSVYGGDLRTGQDGLVVPPQEGRIAVGLSVDLRSNYLFVAGGPSGAAYVYDAETGKRLAMYQFVENPPPLSTFVNDVIVTRDAAYFTDSFRPSMYRVPLGPRGQLPDPVLFEEIPLGGEFVQVPGVFVFNSNGIEALPNGKWLLIVNSTKETLYRVDPETGEAKEIDLGGEPMKNGDGLLLDGFTLYVVQNRLNQIAVVELDSTLTSGEVVRTITNSAFRVPTTIAEFGNALYAVNARFGIEDPSTAEYEAVRVLKR
jgi:hypothetical protein